MNVPRRWRLRTALIGLLAIISSLTFIAVGTILMLVRLPQIDAETRSQLQTESDELAGGTEALLGSLQTQIEMIGSTLFVAPYIGLQSVLERAVSGRSAFNAIYQIGADGTVLRAAVGESIGSARRAELIGSNLSGHLLFRRVKEAGAPTWSDKHLSPVAGNNTVAVAVPSGDTVIVGEVPLAEIFILLSQSRDRRKEPIWIIDQRGDLLVDSEDPARVGVVNLSNLPLGTSSPIDSQPPSDTIQRLVFEGKRYDFAIAHSQLLDWAFVVRSPSGLKNPRIASTLDLGIAALLGSIVLGMLLSPLWASYLARPINAITERARRIAAGETVGTWPRSRTLELNQLSADLESMAAAVHAREQEFKTIFDASPVGISLLDPEAGHVFVRVNQALIELLGYPPEEMLGKTALEIGLWQNPDIRRRLFETLQRDGFGETEGWLRRHDGSEVLAAITARSVVISGRPHTITIARDITELRRAEEDLRQANLVVENSPAMLFRWKAEEGWPVAFVSHNVKQLGYSPDELLDISFRFASLVYPEDLERIGQEMQAYSERGIDQFQQEYRIVAKDGSVRWVDDRTVVERNSRGEITHYQGIVIDITERKRAEEALRQSRNLLQTVLDNIPARVFWKDLESRYLGCNQSFAHDAGVDSSNLMVGRDDYQMGWREQADLYRNDDRQVLESGKSKINYEEPQATPDGRHIWLQTSKVPLRDADGVVFGILGTYQDITERKQAEEALRRSNRQLRMLSDCNQALVRITNEIELLTTICTITVRAGGYRMAWVGYAEQDEPKTIRPMAHAGFEEGYLQNQNITWADDERGLGPMGTAISSGRPGLVQNIAGDSRSAPWRAEAAKRGYAAVCALPLKAGDRIFGALGIFSSAPDAFDAEEIDLLSELASDLAFGVAVLRTRTEHERAEMALKEKTEELDRFFTVALDLLCIADTEGNFHQLNPQWEVVLGYSLSELKNERFLDLVHPDDQASTLAALGQLSTQKVVLNFVNRYRRKDGSYCWIEWKSYPMGNLVYAAARDISERKRAEAELLQHREHLEELVAERTTELRQAMAQLVQSEKLAALGSLVAGVAHELNTPLGNTRVVASSLGEHLHEFAAAVESGALHRSQVSTFLNRGREAVDLLERNTARAADLISHFKQVAVDQTSTRRRSFDLRQTIEEVLLTLRPQFKRTAHRIELEIPPDLELDSYPGPLEQVIANLIGNSLTHGFEGIAEGVIRIRATPLGTTHVEIDFTDNGVGIPETILKRIFDPFFTTRLGKGGSGLGLYIVYNLVTGSLGGAIQVYKPPENGVGFTITLPRTAPDR
ncbi:MAG: PAS domain S-box protein [Propionivibrio sp.]|uniref:PAS domain S-box protein n=1 Tax=Propionivibrio sp. TaxID=2212460 RepID=UPI001A370053|nr:PAS domain S-box protein [Propionivibrio sp.]MBL8416576.1 PAS domain S-box protein [Propionivibrio sp.]